MSDDPHDDLERLLAAFNEFCLDLPQDLRDLSVAEFRRRWEDPQERARMEPAINRAAQTAGPIITKLMEGANRFRKQVLAALDPWAQFMSRLGEHFLRAQRRLEAIQPRVQQVFEVAKRLGKALAQVSAFAAEYGQLYHRQIRGLHDPSFPPLSRDEMMNFALVAIMLRSPEEARLRRPPPLEEVALACNRIDLAAAILIATRPQLTRWARQAVPYAKWEDLPLDVFLTLSEEVLPNIEKRMGCLSMAQARRKLKDWMSDQYLAAAIKGNLDRALQRERARKKRRVREVYLCDHEAAKSQGDRDAERQSLESRAQDIALLNTTVRKYLRQSKRPEVDRQIVAATKRGQSMRKLSQRIGVPERTLRYRRKRLITACRQSLPPTAPDVS